MGLFIDLTGKRFGKLTVVALHPERDRQRKPIWLCKCDCGNETLSGSSNLRAGASSSCGCSRGEAHGGTRSKLYPVWCAMKRRCVSTNDKNYQHYGGRGIAVCDEWSNSFSAFRDWADANGYAEGLSIDRIDNDDGYAPENCRWTTHDVQSRNRRPYKRKEVTSV